MNCENLKRFKKWPLVPSSLASVKFRMCSKFLIMMLKVRCRLAASKCGTEAVTGNVASVVMSELEQYFLESGI